MLWLWSAWDGKEEAGQGRCKQGEAKGKGNKIHIKHRSKFMKALNQSTYVFFKIDTLTQPPGGKKNLFSQLFHPAYNP